MHRTPSSRLALVFAALLVVSGLSAVAGRASAAAADRPLRPGPAYWLAGSDGGVFAFGRAAYAGGAAGADLHQSVVGVAATPSGNGYWLAARDGGVFAFGDAPYLGGGADLALHQQIVDIAATPTGHGYWLAGADGGVFAFGDAQWLGGVAGTALNSPVAAIAATPSGQGYWLVASDGGVFAFGDARWLGGVAGVDLGRPVVDMAATASGAGYWLVASDGGVFAFGDAGFYGAALGMAANRAVVGIAATPTGDGYWLASSNGGVFAFGDAGFYGSAADARLSHPVVAIASGIGTTVAGPPETRLMSAFGYDVSWPQCGRTLPGGQAYGIVGVTAGHLWDVNRCLATEYRWATFGGSLGGLYVNVNWPSVADEPGLAARFADACGPADLGCQAYQWGRRGVLNAVDQATALGVTAPRWWVDVETANRWTPDKALNATVIRGALDALASRGIEAGIYSTWYQWGVIAGDYAPGRPIWVAGPQNVDEAVQACVSGPGFGGGPIWMVQYPRDGFDGNILCAAGIAGSVASFAVPPPPAVPELPAPPALLVLGRQFAI
ncbi:MAG TPA: hypothetical protein VFJ85_05980 [Acidimicrobiales bacterium]|nr:hypothetical protein [Acidimicrobiales bacterium]